MLESSSDVEVNERPVSEEALSPLNGRFWVALTAA
jgi:hypothetical protein